MTATAITGAVRAAYAALQELTPEQRGLVLCWFCRDCREFIPPGGGHMCSLAEPAGLSLYLVVDHDRWGFSHNIVRAENEDAAREIATGDARARGRVEVTKLKTHGEVEVLWCHDESPDSDRS